jgi:hypothetical protein
MVRAGDAALAMACGGVVVDIHCRMELCVGRSGTTSVVKSDGIRFRRMSNSSRNVSGPATGIRVDQRCKVTLMASHQSPAG